MKLKPYLEINYYTFPPSITVFVSFNLSSALFSTISSTVLLATRRITFTGLSTKYRSFTVNFLAQYFVGLHGKIRYAMKITVSACAKRRGKNGDRRL